LIGIDMVFQRSSGSTSTTDEEEAEAMGKQDISVFPIATPLIAGPGAMGAAVLLIADTEGDLILQAIVIGSLLVILAMTLIFMLLSAQVDRLFGKTGMHVITRIMGVLLAALAVQFIFDGIAASGLIPGS
jgi:multiple antibiotic resistance protein